ncbi:hypothetical protein [Haladaptatus sp. DFWS20]|uniref:hypothetical protein n=1 Tax=Haladaptatus sp. DFWS20 TaxID=3403467 RepID=UPI003EB901CF
MGKNDSITGIERRDYLKAITLSGTGLLGLSGQTANATAQTDGGEDTVCNTAQASSTAMISVDSSSATDWTINDRIFGKFIEHNGRDAYPGIYSDHVANGSFEVWNTPTAGDRTAVLYPETATYEGIAYPWEPVETAGNIDFVQNTGGGHGREAEPDLEFGDGVPADKRPSPSGVTQPRYQRVLLTPNGSSNPQGGVKQRTALPDERTLEYVVEFSIRGRQISACDVQLEAADGSVQIAESVPVTRNWQRRSVTLELSTESTQRYRGSPFGEYELSFVVEGQGRVDLDWVILRAGDAINGKFNPTTVELLDEFNVTSLRWPGGNFASQYHWQDGVGPLEDRPVVPNVNWGGLERNYLGTNEFLEFCDLTDIEPILNVGFWSEIPPEEAADWVEYVNGDQSTEMGQLRAEHGYPDPWNVTSWQVGNEVYGDYQVGNADVYEYADEFQNYQNAMQAADSSIDVHAVGIDPMYTDFHDGSSETRFGEPPIWNRELFRIAGQSVMSIDIHRYVRGIINRANREEWLETNNTDPVGYNEVLVNFPSEFDQLMQEVVEEAAQHGIDGLEIDVGEWNLQPQVSPGWPRADYPTMAHAAFTASMFTTFMRRGDAISMSHMRDNSLFWRPYPIDFRPVPPGDYAAQTFAEPFTDGTTEWNRLSITIDSPTRTIPETGIRIRRMEDVPYVDATAIRDAGSGSNAIVYVTNRNLRDTYTTEVSVDGWSPSSDPSSAQVPVVLQTPANGDPFARQTSWTTTNGFDRQTLQLEPNANGNIEVTLPPASIAKLEYTLPVDPFDTETITQNQPDRDTWHQFDSDAQEPRIVIVQPLSYNGGQPAHIRLRNVADGDFEYKLEEWEYLDGAHITETFHSLSVEPTEQTVQLDDDTSYRLTAGTVDVDHTFESVGLGNVFGTETPVVLSQSQTFNGGDPIVTRMRNVSSGSFDVRVQEEEAKGAHTTETVGYIALQQATGMLDGRPFEVGRTGTTIDDSWTRLTFDHQYEQPQFIASMQTFNGNNTANLRYRNLTGTGVDIKVEEEQSADAETAHVAEVVGYAVFEGSV